MQHINQRQPERTDGISVLPSPKSHQQYFDVSIQPKLQFGLVVPCVISASVRQPVVYLGLHAKQSASRADMQIHNLDSQA